MDLNIDDYPSLKEYIGFCACLELLHIGFMVFKSVKEEVALLDNGDKTQPHE